MLILTTSWVPRFPRNPLRGQNKHFTQLYNAFIRFGLFSLSLIITTAAIFSFVANLLGTFGFNISAEKN